MWVRGCSARHADQKCQNRSEVDFDKIAKMGSPGPETKIHLRISTDVNDDSKNVNDDLELWKLKECKGRSISIQLLHKYTKYKNYRLLSVRLQTPITTTCKFNQIGGNL